MVYYLLTVFLGLLGFPVIVSLYFSDWDSSEVCFSIEVVLFFLLLLLIFIFGSRVYESFVGTSSLYSFFLIVGDLMGVFAGTYPLVFASICTTILYFMFGFGFLISSLEFFFKSIDFVIPVSLIFS